MRRGLKRLRLIEPVKNSATLLLIGVLGAFGPACGDDEPSVFVGESSLHEQRVGIVRSGELVQAYVCGGEQNYADHSKWFLGNLADGQRQLSLQNDDAVLELDFDGDRVAVVYRGLATGDAPIDAEAVVAGSAAGLYAGLDSGCRTGVVVTPGGSPDSVRVQGTWCDQQGQFAQVERPRSEDIFEALAQDIGFMVEVQRPDGPRSFRVEAVAP